MAASFFYALVLAIETSLCYFLSPKYDYKLEDLETALKATIEQDKYQRTCL
jgi:hypothetical protein